MADVVRVVFAADTNYVMPLAASVRSVIDNCRSPVEIAILARGISGTAKGKLLRSWGADADIEFFDLDDASFGRLGDLERRGHTRVTSTSYARLMAPEVLPQSWHRVVYLDVDTITIGDIGELWDVDLEGAPCAGVQEVFVSLLATSSWPYVNSGVLLIDLDAWRRDGIGRLAIEWARARSTSDRPPSDTKAINHVLKGNWKALDETWNLATPMYMKLSRNGRGPRTAEHRRILEAERIRHFQVFKPWEKRYAEIPGSALFYEYLDRTQWRGWRP
jgi:lipopolysaccharide biosynthesis glycosyltransferase